MLLTLKQLSAAVGVSKTQAHRLRKAGVIPPPDARTGGCGTWSADRIPALKAAVLAHREAGLENLRAALRLRDERAKQSGSSTGDVLRELGIPTTTYYRLMRLRLLPRRPAGGWTPETIRSLKARAEAVKAGTASRMPKVEKLTPTARQVCRVVFGMLVDHFDGDERAAERFLEGFAGAQIKVPALADVVLFLNERRALSAMKSNASEASVRSAAATMGVPAGDAVRRFRDRTGVRVSKLREEQRASAES